MMYQLNFQTPEWFFLLGKSGSGKSTLLNVCGGLDICDSGEIIVKGKSSKSFSKSDFDSYRNTFIGFIFQEYNILDELEKAMHEYIDYYNNKRISTKLKGLTPIMYRHQSLKAVILN